MKKLFIEILQVSLGTRDKLSRVPSTPEWIALFKEAQQQGVSSLLTEGLDKIGNVQRPPKDILLQWIGLTTNEEKLYFNSWKTSCELALLLKRREIKTYVLKGFVLSECYPTPQHRRGVDMDCFLKSEGNSEVWELGNDEVQKAGFEVRRDYYKNSTWVLPGLTVENHKYLTPFRGNKRLKSLEVLLQDLLRMDKGTDYFDGTELIRPPVMVSALFLIEHAYSHFLHEGLNWRHVLDWVLFSKKHKEKIDWELLNSWIDKYGFRRFYNSYDKIGLYLIGKEVDLTEAEKMMMADIWSPLDVHDTNNCIMKRLASVGNTWRARWKYREFTDMTWIKALWIQVKGFLFMKKPKLS